jgi:pimeloyl-ACP methyl ester carboxylesterase
MAAAIHGIFFGRIAPSSRLRRRITVPALVVGHPRDPIHPAADAAMLADELPDSTFVEAHGILEWRLRPGRLNDLATAFVERCFAADQSAKWAGG